MVIALTGTFVLFISNHTPDTPIATYCGSLTAIWIGLFAASTSRMGAIWKRFKTSLLTKPTRRDEAQRKHIRNGFRELFGYLLSSLIGLSFVAFFAGNPEMGPMSDIKIKGDLIEMSIFHLSVFCGFFVSAFIPLIWAFALQAQVEAKLWKSTVLRSDVISRSSLVISSLAIGGIVSLAWAAGADKFDMTEDFGVYVTLIVVVCFLVFIISPHMARLINNRLDAEERAPTHAAGISAISPETWISWIDSALVRLIAPLSGATQHGPGVPHLLVVCLVLPLSAMGFVLGSPFGLVPIFAAMLIILALGRRWAWVEEDRETASRLQSTEIGKTRDIHVGFDNDLKDEALLGYASLFILVPLALFQIQGTSHAFAQNADLSSGNQFFDWLRFFGAELAKAVPFVDWWEIYQVDVQTPFTSENDSALAKHLTFAARAMVDLVIMAALVQAFGIWQRGRTQNRLYDAGHINSFDPFTEQEFFERGMKPASRDGDFIPKRKFVKRVQEHIAQSRDLNLLPQPYSSRRLSELIRSENKEVSAGAKWMVETFGVLAGAPTEQLAQLTNQWREPFSFPKLYSTARDNTDLRAQAKAKNAIRNEKLKFERLLDDLHDANVRLNLGQTGSLISLMEAVRGAPEFIYAHTVAIELLGHQTDEFIVLALAAHALSTKARIADPTWQQRIHSKFGRHLHLFQGRVEMRILAFENLRNVAGRPGCADTRQNDILSFLDLMSEHDGSQVGRNKAAELAASIRSGPTDLFQS